MSVLSVLLQCACLEAIELYIEDCRDTGDPVPQGAGCE